MVLEREIHLLDVRCVVVEIKDEKKPDETIVSNQIDVEEVRLITTPVSIDFRKRK